MKELAYLNKYHWRYRYKLLLGFLFIVASNVFKVLTPGVVRDATDAVVEYLQAGAGVDAGGLDRQLLAFAGWMLLFAVSEGIFLFFTRQTIIVVSRQIEYDLRNEIYQHYQELDTAFYKRNKTGDLMNRITEDVNHVRNYLGPALMYGINLTVLLCLCLGIMFYISPRMTLYVIAPMPILSISIFYVNNLINKGSERIQRKLSDLTAFAQETFAGIRVVKSYVRERYMRKFFLDESNAYKDSSLHLARIEALFFPLMMLLTGTSTLLVIYFGGLEVIAENMTMGRINQFLLYLIYMTWPITAIGWVASIIQRAAASQKRINEFLGTKPEIPVEEGGLMELEGEIEFRNLSFTYPDTGIQALKDVNFKIAKGERWAIVGRTGSGKTTITDLLLRMYDPGEGQVLVDGRDIRELHPGRYREQIGYVPQDSFLFSDSIEANIDFGAGNSLYSARDAASMASVDADISGFSEGYDTVIGERGVTLSGGQKQRISIARALRKDPKILVLDDCLSAVDARTEKAIIGALDTYMEGRTSIVITHRIFALLNFDNILVLEEGRIVESGTHEQLLKSGGFYAELFEKQQAEEEN